MAPGHANGGLTECGENKKKKKKKKKKKINETEKEKGKKNNNKNSSKTKDGDGVLIAAVFRLIEYRSQGSFLTHFNPVEANVTLSKPKSIKILDEPNKNHSKSLYDLKGHPNPYKP